MSLASNRALADQFYSAFVSQDVEAMVSCYAPAVIFEDPAFGQLKEEHASNMWRMLIESQKGKDFKVSYEIKEVTEHQVKVVWQAWYNFSKTGRPVHNIITAELRIQDGKIIRHTDHFDLYRWARQAMGFQGLFLGWTRFFKSKLQHQTNRLLIRYEKG